VAGCASADGVALVSGGVVAGAGGAGESAHRVGDDQRDDLDRQVAGLSGWAGDAGGAVVPVEAEVGSAINGVRREVQLLLADRRVVTVVVVHRDRCGPPDTELVAAALSGGWAGVWWCWIAAR
jgi:hypothetical protein